MNIQQYQRNKFNLHIIPLIKNNECELCGDCNNLELHHTERFVDLLKETLSDLRLDYKESLYEYSNNELELITNVMLGKQIRSKYITVCKTCHIDIHTKEKKKIINHGEIMNYIKSIIGKRLHKKDRVELINIIGVTNKNGRFIRSISKINEFLMENKYGFIIYSKREA